MSFEVNDRVSVKDDVWNRSHLKGKRIKPKKKKFFRIASFCKWARWSGKSS